jgi:hypothetical protein
MRYGVRRRAIVPIDSCHFALRRFHGIAIHLAVLISRSTENGRWRRLVVDRTDFDPAGQKNWAAMANKARTTRTDKRFVGAETWRRLRMNHTLHTSPASKGPPVTPMTRFSSPLADPSSLPFALHHGFALGRISCTRVINGTDACFAYLRQRSAILRNSAKPSQKLRTRVIL